MKFAAEAAGQGLWREALFRWERQVKARPDNARLHNNIAVASESLGDHVRALNEYAVARRLDAGSREIHANQQALRDLCLILKTCPEETPPEDAAATEKSGDTVRVTIDVSIPARLDLTGIERVLITRMVVDQEARDLDLGRELVTLLRRELHKRTRLEILDVEPPALPEQPMADLLANSGFWRRLAETHNADLVISGRAAFQTSDRSGFVEVDEISPQTGQRIRRTRYVDREAFSLGFSLFFIRGRTGRLAFEDEFTGERTITGGGGDPLSVLYELFEQMAADVTGIAVAKTKPEQRYLFEE